MSRVLRDRQPSSLCNEPSLHKMKKIRNIDEALLPQYISNYISFLNDLDIQSQNELQKDKLGFVNDFNTLSKCDILACVPHIQNSITLQLMVS